MASDLSQTPTTGLTVQACGDAHLSNFGLFGSAERTMVFDVNDFDETLPGPWEWDLKRLATSLEVAARSREFSDKERRRIVQGAVQTYRTSMQEFALMSNLAVWYARFDVKSFVATASDLSATVKRRTESVVAKARTADSMKAYEKLTHIVNGRPRIISDPPLIVPIDELLGGERAADLKEQMQIMIRSYRRTLETDRRLLLEEYKFVDMAQKVVGVGSVGTRSWILLLMGKDERDPLFLQAKEAQASVLERFTKKSQYTNHGQRVVAGQRLMQASSDIFLGWERVDGIDGVKRDFYIRQLKDWKGSADIDQMVPDGMEGYGKGCAWTLARAHARSGDRIAISAYMGSRESFDEAVYSFSVTYADQNEKDYEVLQEAVQSGRITARTGL
jgi:uncharacterized protein (DUF2252 family)